MATTAREIREHRPPTRGRWWLLIVALIGGIALLDSLSTKPARYTEEAATMERVAGVLGSPVVYERIEGRSGAAYVTYVYLPDVELDEKRTHELARLLGELPKLECVFAHYVQDQPDRVEQLKRELRSADVSESLPASSEDMESRQERFHVAGVDPGLLQD